MIPRYKEVFSEIAETIEVALALLKLETVPEAPLESVIIISSKEAPTPMSNKSTSNDNSSPTSTSLAVASKRIFPSPVSSSNKNPAPASELSASVPFKVSVSPNSSLATNEPASLPFASVPSRTINPTSFSRRLSINKNPSSLCVCLGKKKELILVGGVYPEPNSIAEACLFRSTVASFLTGSVKFFAWLSEVVLKRYLNPTGGI